MIEDLKTVPRFAGGRYVNRGEKDAGDDLQNEKHETGGAEDVPPRGSLRRHRMRGRVADEICELNAALYPIVGSFVPAFGVLCMARFP